MTAHGRPERSESFLGRLAARRSVRFVAFGTAAALAAGAIASAGGGTAGASTTLSQSTGRFLSGTIGGQNLDQAVLIPGESASYPDNPGPNANELNPTLLGQVNLPIGDKLHLPGPGSAITFGAVAQYAVAHKDGSALGAAGAIDSNGGISVGGSNGVPEGGATIDLSGLPGASAATDALGNLVLKVGAVSARARQVSIGNTITDASAGCDNKPYSRISNNDQTGQYQVAGLSLSLNSPVVAQAGKALITAVGTALDGLNTALNALNKAGLPVSVKGVPTTADLEKGLTVSSDGITLSLVDGSIKIDVAALLQALGLDLNNLCPNTSLLPYVAQAFATLPAKIAAALSSLSTSFTDLFSNIVVNVNGKPLPTNELKPAITTATTAISGALTTATTQLSTSALMPLVDALTQNLLDIVVNGQNESGGKFAETAVKLTLVPGGAPNDVVLNLARATVGPNAAPTAAPSSSTPPVSTVAPTAIPTGVPAGQARPAGGTGALPMLLTLLALIFAGGGAFAVRMRGRHAR